MNRDFKIIRGNLEHCEQLLNIWKRKYGMSVETMFQDHHSENYVLLVKRESLPEKYDRRAHDDD